MALLEASKPVQLCETHMFKFRLSDTILAIEIIPTWTRKQTSVKMGEVVGLKRIQASKKEIVLGGGPEYVTNHGVFRYICTLPRESTLKHDR